MADITDFELGQGETFKILAHVYTENDNTAFLDITDYKFVGQLKENFTTDEVAAEFIIEKATPFESGSIFISLLPEQSIQLEQRSYVYDVVMINESTSPFVIRRLLQGGFTILPAVTKNF